VTLLYTGAALVFLARGYVESVSLPADPPAPQASVLYYRDGHTILARVGVADHSDVPLSAIPLPVRRAVLAAEDRDFYHHDGISARGVARAALADVGGARQGASTITQQYVRNAHLTQERSVQRKARELALAIKVERRYTKDEILGRYLSTIYFGRGAYGIAAAAHAYFGIRPEELTLAQGAVLAALIKDPWHFDPAVDEAAARERWDWIVAAMHAQRWSEGAAPAYPGVLPKSAESAALGGPNGLVVDQVERELDRHGITPQVLRTSGLSVTTTLDPAAQAAALDSVASSLGTQPAGLRAALVAIDPSNGAVRAYYGGNRGRGYYDDAAARRPAGATFKPIALAAALGEGVGYASRWDGSSPRMFADRNGVPLVNRDDAQCANCTLDRAMVQSLNTPFYAVTEQIGAARVRDVAVASGIPATYGDRPSLVDLPGDPRPGRTRADIAIGRYPVAPADLASVYATFAAGGVHSARSFVVSVSDRNGRTWWTAQPERHRVLDPRVAADVSTVLTAVVNGNALAPGRPAAGKPGAQQWGDTRDNQDAWMVGYTPQLAVAVWLGRPVPGPIRDVAGRPITGETVPAQLWRDFLARTLHDQPVLPFPAATHVGRTDVGDAGRAGSNPDAPYGKRAPVHGPQPVTRTAHRGRYLALTFDDGISDYTTEVLDLLDQYHVKATFCVVGDNVVRYPKTLRRIVAAGHALCNHSSHHDDLGSAPQARVAADIEATDAAIATAAPGAVVTYFRAPYGDWGSTPAVAARLGHTPLAWAIDAEDWKLPGTGTIVAHVTSRLTPGAVVLLHDGGGDRRQTIDALKILIPRLRQQGWAFDQPMTTVRPSSVPSLVPASPSPAPAPEATDVTPSEFPSSAPPSPSEPTTPDETESADD